MGHGLDNNNHHYSSSWHLVPANIPVKSSSPTARSTYRELKHVVPEHHDEHEEDDEVENDDEGDLPQHYEGEGGHKLLPEESR